MVVKLHRNSISVLTYGKWSKYKKCTDMNVYYNRKLLKSDHQLNNLKVV